MTRMLAILFLLALLVTPCSAQVPPHLYLKRASFEIGEETATGFAAVPITNGRTTPVLVTLSVHRDARDEEGNVVPGDSVSSLLSPQSFTLDPGAQQTVRVVVTDSITPGEVLRLVTLLEPTTDAEALPIATASAATSAQVRLRIRFVTKLEVR